VSRSGYVDDMEDSLAFGRWRAQVASSIRGARGQKALREILAALDAMPEKSLIREELKSEDGVCALGALGDARHINMQEIDPEDPDAVAAAFDISHQLASEIAHHNDEYLGSHATGAQVWQHMHDWIAANIREETNADDAGRKDA
jgi:hypothetical protein